MISLGTYLSQKYTNKKIISESDTEIYAFLFDYIFGSVFYDLSLILIGAIAKQLIITLIFILITAPIRTFSGGYHAKTRIRCNILSYSVFFSYLFISNIVNVNSTLLQIIIYISTWGLIFLISPVESENKHFTNENRKNLRKRLFISFIIITIITITIFLLNYIREVCSINICLIICTLSLYIGYYSKMRSLKS